jgi:hypothetical protein
VLPQNAGDSAVRSLAAKIDVDSNNVVWFPQSFHTRTDTWGDRPWITDPPFWVNAGFTDESSVDLYQAYMLGTWGITYSFFKYDYNTSNPEAVKSYFIPTSFDGVSNFVYGYSWLVNTPQKFMNQLAYVISPKSTESSKKKFWYLLGDLVVQVLVTSLEAGFALMATMFGVVVGTVLHPVNTVAAIPGGIVDLIDATFTAGWNLLASVWHVITSCLALARSLL